MSSGIITSIDYPKTGLERYKKYQPQGSLLSTSKVATHHHISKKRQSAEQLMTYAGGKVLIIDGAYWGENIEYYFGEVKNTLLEGEQLLGKYGLSPEHAGVLYGLEKIPGGYRQTHLGFYLVNPQALGKFTKEVLKS